MKLLISAVYRQRAKGRPRHVYEEILRWSSRLSRPSIGENVHRQLSLRYDGEILYFSGELIFPFLFLARGSCSLYQRVSATSQSTSNSLSRKRSVVATLEKRKESRSFKLKKLTKISEYPGISLHYHPSVVVCRKPLPSLTNVLSRDPCDQVSI